ncbi:uncharacterized protein PRCAT00003933001 [Priceomyces carsonii]|uniref:uncharacterized protein n=1 Tax=Priceomyces carsonii TaxID=28549 RepID=UPI002EDB0E59|nr:unnamed protein product [Priceomyces carsonii]
MSQITPNVYKRQNISNGTVNRSVIPSTVYEEPEKTLLNFPSSVMNGVTREGGLVSLTFKSVKFVDLVEKFDMIKETLYKDYKDGLQLPKINDEGFDAKTRIQELNVEIETLKNKRQKVTNDRKEEPYVKVKQEQLLSIVHDKKDVSPFGEEIIKQYESERSDKAISFSHGQYTFLKNFSVPSDLKIQKFEDVNNPDMLAYAKKNSQTSSEILGEEDQGEPLRELQTPSNTPLY